MNLQLGWAGQGRLAAWLFGGFVGWLAGEFWLAGLGCLLAL